MSIAATPSASQIVEHLPDPVLIVAASGGDPADRTVIYANASARERLRIPAGEAPLAAVLRHPALLDAVDTAFAGTAAQAIYETTGAQPRWWRAEARTLDGAGGPHVLLTLHDDTDARRNERMRADFLANASHELRTPLASLSGFIETLRGHAREDTVARERFLAIMSTQAQRMTRLIEDLLSLSRIEMNEHIAPHGRVDIADAVGDMLNAVQPMLAARRVVVEPALTRGAKANADRDQVAQVLQNLFDNALKYSPAGTTIRIEVGLAESFEAALAPQWPGAPRLSLLTPARTAAGFVSVRIVDAGPGIGRAYLPRLSERFYRVEGQKSGEREGTGLGLAIVKHIINRHRGGLAVESLEGQGTAFIVCLPRAPDLAVPS